MNGVHEQRSDPYAASLASVQEAASRIAQFAHETPVLTCGAIDRLAGRSLFFKCETFQKGTTLSSDGMSENAEISKLVQAAQKEKLIQPKKKLGGAFKFRGACNAVFSLTDEEAKKGVLTHSSGNHAGALALAALLRGIPAQIVLPSNTPQCKVDAVESYQATIIKCHPTMDAREAECSRLQAKSGATFIPPYNDSRIISGQGTVALELLRQVPDLDAIIVPVSGGGLISGISIAAKELKPSIVIIAAEPTGSNNAADVAASKVAGRIVPLEKPKTIADGLQGRLGNLTWPAVRDLVSGVVTVSDKEIVHAMQLLFERMKVVVEPSGAAALAAALSPKLEARREWSELQRIGIVLSGGNADLSQKGLWNMWEASQ